MSELKVSALIEVLDRFTEPAKRIASVSEKVAGALVRDQAAYRKLADQAGSIGGLQALEGQLGKVGNELGIARAKVSQLAAELKKNPTEALQAEFSKAQQQVKALANAHSELTNKAQSARTELRGLGVDTRDLGSAGRAATAGLGELQARMERVAAAAEKLDQAAKQRDAILQRSANLSLAAQSAERFGQQVTGALSAPVQAATSLQSGLVDLGITASLPAERLAQIRQDLLAMGPAVNQGPDKLLESLRSLNAQGMDVPGALAALPAIGKTATATGAQLADLTNTSFALMSNLKVAPEQLGATLDALATAGKAGSFELKDMAAAFPSLTGQMQALKMEGPEAAASLAAALQVVRTQSADASEAANNLRNLLSKITAPETVKNFKEKAGLDLKAIVMAAQANRENPLEKVLEAVKKSTGGDMFKVGQLFGDMQVLGAIRPMLEQMDRYREIRNEAISSQGTVNADFARRVGEDPAQGIQRLNLALDTLKERVGSALLPSIAKLVDLVSPLAERLASFAENHKVLTTGVVGLTAVLGGAALVVAPVLGGIAAITAALAHLGFSARKAALESSLATSGRSGGMSRGLKLAGGAGLALGAMDIASTMMDGSLSGADKAAAATQTTGGMAGAMAGAAAGSLLGPVGTVVGGIVGGMGGDMLGGMAAEQVRANYDAIVAAVSTGVDVLVAKTRELVNAGGEAVAGVTAMVGGVYDGMVSRVSGLIEVGVTSLSGLGVRLAGAWEGLSAQIGAAIDGLVAIIFDKLAALPARMAEVGTQIVEGLKRGISDKVSSVGDTITGMGDAIVDWFSDNQQTHSPSRRWEELGGFLGQGLSIGIQGTVPGVTKAATAMTMAAGVSLPAIAAPGLPTLPQLPPVEWPAEVSPVSASGGSGAVTGGNAASAVNSTFNITIHAQPGQDGEVIARAVRAEMERWQRDQALSRRGRLFD